MTDTCDPTVKHCIVKHIYGVPSIKASFGTLEHASNSTSIDPGIIYIDAPLFMPSPAPNPNHPATDDHHKPRSALRYWDKRCHPGWPCS